MSTAPFDHEGRFYKFSRAFSEIRSVQQPHVPIWFGGLSDAAVRVGARPCDTFALFGEPRAAVARSIGAIRAEAAKHDRAPKFNVSFRPIIAATEEAAWEKAHAVLRGIEATTKPSRHVPEAENARRLGRLVR